jgi:hypothetical protein
VTEEERTCKECGEAKPLAGFATYKAKGKNRPLRTCKPCHRTKERARQRRYLKKNREAHNKRVRETKRDKYHSDPEYREKLCQDSRDYYEAHRQKLSQKQREQYAANRLEILERRRELYEKNKDVYRPTIVGSTSTSSLADDLDPLFEELFEELFHGAQG